jgi:sulfatase maturation enzyme AslB (radical SAM superfamily)
MKPEWITNNFRCKYCFYNQRISDEEIQKGRFGKFVIQESHSPQCDRVEYNGKLINLSMDDFN